MWSKTKRSRAAGESVAWMSCLFTLVSRTGELSTDVNVCEETKGLWGVSEQLGLDLGVCVCVHCEGGGKCVQVSMSGTPEVGTLSQ